MVKFYAKGGKNRPKRILNALALTLYFPVERNHRKIIDTAVQSHQISLNVDDDNEETSITAIGSIQFKRLEEVVNFVAKVHPQMGYVVL